MRPLRIQYSGAVYYVMNRGASRQQVFRDKQDYEAFLKTLGEVFETASYGGVGWACHGVTSRMQTDAKFRDHVGSIRRISQ